MALTIEALQDLPLNYEVKAPDVAALSGEIHQKGIHPLLQASPPSVVILCTVEGGEYPNRWLDPERKTLLYFLEGRWSKKLGRKRYKRETETNLAVAGSSEDGYHVHVFWRTRDGLRFRYAGRYVFGGYITEGFHEAFVLLKVGQKTVPAPKSVPASVKRAVRKAVGKKVTEEDLERAMASMSDEAFATWSAGVNGEGSVEDKARFIRVRKMYRGVVKGLKAKYGGQCQLCGGNPFDEFGAKITEGHHIDHFSKSFDNRPSNIAILCPNHHSLLHEMEATFDRQTCEFVLRDGQRLPLKLDYHLRQTETTGQGA